MAFKIRRNVFCFISHNGMAQSAGGCASYCYLQSIIITIFVLIYHTYTLCQASICVSLFSFPRLDLNINTKQIATPRTPRPIAT